MKPDREDNDNIPKIAIVAVHGVSDQKPFASARAIADLLLNSYLNQKTNYTPFSEKLFSLIVNPVKVNYVKTKTVTTTNNQEKLRKLKNWLYSYLPNERGEIINQRLNTPIDNQLNPNTFESKPIDLDFTRDRLKNYSQSGLYDTICLQGQQISSQGDEEKTENNSKKVHIYEMHWADLSHLGTGFIRIFGSLFQLLFHLSSLGHSIINSTRIRIRESYRDISPQKLQKLDNRFQWWGRFQVGSSLMLSLLLPVLNLYLLIAAFSGLPIALLPLEYLPIITTVILGIIVGILCLKFLINSAKISFGFIPIIPVFIGFFSAFVFHQLMHSSEPNYNIAYVLITIIWDLLLIGICYVLLVKPFDRHRPGSKKFTIAIGIFLLITTFICNLLTYLLQQKNVTFPALLTDLSLNFIEITYLFLVLAWIVFNLLYCLAIIWGLYGFIGLQSYRTSERGFLKNIWRGLLEFKQVFITTQFSLILPAFFLLFITVVFWQILANFSSSLFLSIRFYRPLIFNFLIQNPSNCYDNIQSIQSCNYEFVRDINFPEILTNISSLQVIPDSWQNITNFTESITYIYTPDEFLNKLMQSAHSPITNATSLAFLLILGIIICSFLPAILTDIQPPNQSWKKSYSVRLGNWLTNGFNSLLLLIGLLILAAPIIGLSSNIATISDILNPKELSPIPPVFRLSVYIVTGSATSLIAFGNRLNRVSSGIRDILDTILDVDNYLRLHPKDDTPRARIFARYVSLLRYLCQWKDPQDNCPYDAIIIVSHSQGTVITADLLRLLSVDTDDDLASCECKLPIYLFTMGSPLKQLYHFAFSDLYNWVSHPERLALQLQKINVKEWVNCYHSGDYIGRYIWSNTDDNTNIWQPLIIQQILSQPIVIKEYCLGAGGHIHYWNSNTPEVAAEINRLITSIEK